METSPLSNNNTENVKLYIRYESINNHQKFDSCIDNEGHVVKLSQIWINHFPLNYLKNIQSKLPKEVACKKTSTGYELDMEYWNKLSDQVSLPYRWKGTQAITEQLPSCLKICGLKQVITAAIGPLIDESYLLYFENDQLDDFLTIYESGLSKSTIIDVLSQTALKGNVFLESGSPRKSVFESVDTFHRLYQEINQKIDIVCQVLTKTASGSALLIGPFFILTNSHVVKTSTNAKAIFFYHDDSGSKMLPVSIEFPAILESQSPEACKPVNDQSLDYAIFRLKDEELSAEAKKNLLPAAIVGKALFDASYKDYQDFKELSPKEKLEELTETSSLLNRATIIQHPNDNASSSIKKIAFRENHLNGEFTHVVHYKALTSHGSSGSPVLNTLGKKLLGLHYSKCQIPARLIFKYRDPIFNSLGFAYLHKDENKFLYKREKEELWVYRSEKNKGGCSLGGKEPIMGLQDFLIQRIESNQHTTLQSLRKKIESLKLNQENTLKKLKKKVNRIESTSLKEQLEQFILSCVLEKTDQEKVKGIHKHLNCSTGINIKAIFRNLEANGRMKKLQQEIASVNARLQKERKTRMWSYLSVIGGILAIAFTISVIWKRKRTT